jgi:inhibitor of KinA
LVEVVPAYVTVTVFYDPLEFSRADEDAFTMICDAVRSCASAHTPEADPGREWEIPVCYGGEFGPDLDQIAEHCGLGTDEVVSLHSGAEYLVHAIGFTPGFPFLGGLPARLATPRRSTPRTRVPAGSVGIGGAQTGVYPTTSPGGWQILGRSPLTLFHPERSHPSLVRPGDRVRFRKISREEFDAWK